jgi:hypothetical protein
VAEPDFAADEVSKTSFEARKRTRIEKGEIMKKALLTALAMLFVCGSAPAGNKKIKLSAEDLQKRQVAKAGDHLIVPSSGIGPVKLGMAQDQVLAILGQPDYTVPAKRYFSPKYMYDSLNLVVYFSQDAAPTVISITAQAFSQKGARPMTEVYWKYFEAVETNWSTPQGVNLGATSFDIKRAYSAYQYEDTAGVMMDYKRLGISFSVSVDHKVYSITVSAPQ